MKNLFMEPISRLIKFNRFVSIERVYWLEDIYRAGKRLKYDFIELFNEDNRDFDIYI